jgi:5-methylcytosine-specific restriction protein A
MKKLIITIIILIFCAALFAARSNGWPKVRAEFLKTHPACCVCGSTKNLEVHHVLPVHLFPEKELDPNNLITLCESKKYGVNCHLFFGHLGDYKKYNPNVRKDAAGWNRKLKQKFYERTGK